MPRIRTCSSLAGKRGVPEAAAPAEKFSASVTHDGAPYPLVGWHTMTTERIADHVKFAYWVPNVSGGLVTSDIEQRTDWNYEYNAKLSQTAENNGFEYALSQGRYEASYGAEYQHESTSFSLALLLATQRLKVIAAVHPGLWHTALAGGAGRALVHPSRG